MNDKNHAIYEFGNYRLDRDERVLQCAGDEIALTPTLFEILLTLVENSGRILDKEHFMQRVWSGRVVEDGNLARNISSLRRILGDDSHDPRYIETVPRRGYRFVAKVRFATRDVNSPPLQSGTDRSAETFGADAARSPLPPPAWRRGWPRARVAVAFAGAALSAALLLASGPKPDTQPAEPSPIRSLIVLPLESRSGDVSEEWFTEGMTEALIARLGTLRALHVTSLTTSLHYRGARKLLPEIAEEVGADGVVEAAVLRSGERVRMTIQLVDARTDTVLWTEAYERHVDDVLALQGEMARMIAQRIELALSPEESRRLTAAPAVDFETQEAYLRGLHFKNKHNVDALHAAISEFDRALVNEPDFAPALAAMADTYMILASWQGPSRTYWPKARAAANRALQLDDTLAEAHVVRAGALLCHDLNHSAADSSFHRALQLRPNDPSAHARYAYSLASQGRFDESVTHLQRAVELDPVSLGVNTGFGRALHFAGRGNEALRQLQRTLDLDPQFAPAHRYLGLVHLSMGEPSKAIGFLETAFDLGGGPGVLGELAYAYAMAGEEDEALIRLETLEEWTREGLDTAYSIALAHHGLGRTERALEWLHKAYHERDFRMILLLVDPVWDDVRDNPSFEELLLQIGLGHKPH